MYPQGNRQTCKRIWAQVILKGSCPRMLSAGVRGLWKHATRTGADGAGVIGAQPGENCLGLVMLPQGGPLGSLQHTHDCCLQNKASIYIVEALGEPREQCE